MSHVKGTPGVGTLLSTASSINFKDHWESGRGNRKGEGGLEREGGVEREGGPITPIRYALICPLVPLGENQK